MRFVSLSEFSKKTGIPLQLLRKNCREGKIPCIRNGNRFLLDEDCKEKIVEKMMQKQDLIEKIRRI